jgi:AcrR family transcriptional regulator
VDAILSATTQVLLRDGWARLTTTRIARRAGVSVGTVYQYFADRDAIGLALLARSTGRVIDAVTLAAAGARGLPVEDACAVVVEAFLAEKARHAPVSFALRPFLDTSAGRAWADARTAEAVTAVAALLHDLGVSEPERVARVVVDAIDGAVDRALGRGVEAVADPNLRAELVALASGYVARRAG